MGPNGGWADPGVWTGRGGGGGGACPMPDQTMPWRTGTLAAGTGCSPCPPAPQPDSGPEGGTIPPPGDTGARDGCTSGNANLTLGGTTFKTGPSPLDLDYTVDLTAVPENARIIRAKPTYMGVGGAPQVITDDGGYGGTPAEWSDAGVALLNAAGRDSSFDIHARLTFGSPPPSGQFAVTVFNVTWCTAVGT